ncbi:MAG: RNA polymerase sigma factor [Prevotella sp.]|nr:RNA polymerase sigma factor [Prevotella sp.]
MEQPNDKDILGKLLNPKTRRATFGNVVGQYSEMLYWKIRRIVLFHDDANDVLQNTFMKAWKALDNFRGDSQLTTWLCRIAINESLDFMRHKQALTIISSDSQADATGMAIHERLMADEYFDGDKTEALLQEAISRLPEVQRTVFLLRYYDEMKYSEMSKVLNTSEGALKASYHIAVSKIKDFFKTND